jgi:hypothetical protein
MIFERCHRKLVAIMYHRFKIEELRQQYILDTMKKIGNFSLVVREDLSLVIREFNVQLNSEINSIMEDKPNKR